MLSNRHLLGLKNYPSQAIQTIIETAFQFKEVLDRPIKKVVFVKDKLVNFVV